MNPEETTTQEGETTAPAVEEIAEETPAEEVQDLGVNVSEEVTSQEAIG